MVARRSFVAALLRMTGAGGGEKNIALGGDFDGITYKMSDIDSCEKLYILFGELAKLNYTEEQICGIAYKNFINFFEGI